ncbi:hypothetical protein MXB_4425 [Myxobolus squamalis]|nr:hypothetical protein MXB_4425 [Myxobolus squamalis]
MDISLENMLQTIPGNNLFLDQRLIISSNEIVKKNVEDVNIDRYLLAKKFVDQLAAKNLSTNLKDCIRKPMYYPIIYYDGYVLNILK